MLKHFCKVSCSLTDFTKSIDRTRIVVGNVHRDNFSELPAKSLNAISEVGMSANHYANAKDINILHVAFEPVISYIKLWKKGEDGFIVNRPGD